MKYAYIALLILVLYVAGMYESAALMVLFMVQLFLIPLMLALAFYLKRHMKAEAEEQTVYAEINIPFMWRLRTVNSGRLPVGRFTVRFSCSGRAIEKNKKIKIRGSAERGEELHSFRDVCPHCGTAVLRADKLRVYDYMSLFSSGRRIEEEIAVIVFPRKYEMNIELDDSTGEEGDQSAAGNNYGEIRQIREYRDGDSIRHIHWNQTARSDKLWVKEYETEKAGRIRLLLELGDVRKYSASDIDAFYTLLYALVSGLLVNSYSVLVIRSGTEKPLAEITDDGECREMLAELYRTAEEPEGDFNGYERLRGDMCLTAELEWYAVDRLIFKFSKETLTEELTGRAFVIQTGEMI